ncbi:MAG: SAM hydroxide adenosyltransferase, partial [Nevskiales bacterium]
LAEVIYVDHYGNAMSGLSADSLDKNQSISVAGQSFHYARTFSEVDIDQAFWTVNSLGLVEIAVNQGSAANRFNLQIGSALF